MFDEVKTPLQTLHELKQAVELAISIFELGGMKPMTEQEILERRASFGDCDMILGNFKVTRI
jgi:hypothetical protein